MKAILEFNLPKERSEFTRSAYAGDLAYILFEVMQETRGWLKYGHTFKTPEEAIEAVRKMIIDSDTMSILEE